MAAPTYQAQGAVVSSTTGNVSPAWPAHQAGDIALLVVECGGLFPELAVPAGFRQLPNSPRKAGGQTDSGNAVLAVYWCRATSAAMSNPTVGFVRDRIQACILTFRGCSATGEPFTRVASYLNHTASSVARFPPITTTDADSLIVGVVANSGFTSTSGWVNSDLTSLTERLDSSISIGNGTGLSVVTGVKATPGSVVETIGNFSGSSKVASITIALSPVDQPPNNYPYLHKIGTPDERATAGTIAPAWPTHEAGDIGLLIVESGAWPVTFANAQGFVEVPGSPQNANSSGTSPATGLSVYWKRAASGAEPSPTINYIGDHIRGLIAVIKNAVPSGTPIDVGAGNKTTVNTDAVTFPAVTTTAGQELVVMIGTNSEDLPYTEHYVDDFTNANLDYITPRHSLNSTIGNGSGIGIVVARAPDAEDIGTTTGTIDVSSYQSYLTLAFKPFMVERTIDAGTGIFTLAGQPVDFAVMRRLEAGTGVFTLSGQPVDFPIINNYVIEAGTGVFSLDGQPVTFRKTFGRWSRKDRLLNPPWVKKPPLED